MSLILFLCLIFVLRKRWFYTKKTLRSRSSTVWLLSLFEYFLQSCLSSFRSFFSVFWPPSSVLSFVFQNIYLLFSLRPRTRDASRVSLNRKIFSSSFMTSFSTNSFLLIYKVSLSCSFSCLVLFWFVRIFLKAHQMRFDCLLTSRQSRSSYFDDLNE